MRETNPVSGIYPVGVLHFNGACKKEWIVHVWMLASAGDPGGRSTYSRLTAEKGMQIPSRRRGGTKTPG